jgi:hypothetical protein
MDGRALIVCSALDGATHSCCRRSSYDAQAIPFPVTATGSRPSLPVVQQVNVIAAPWRIV